MSTTILVERAPSTAVPSEAKSFFADADESVVEWRTHFDRKPNGLKPGETVAAEVTLETYKNQTYLRVADASCGADSFLLDDKARDTLADLAGSTFAALMTITSPVGSFACHGQQYAISPHIRVATLPLNPTFEELTALHVNSRVVIEGRVTRMTVVEEPKYMNGQVYHTSKRGVIFIDTPHGEFEVQSLAEEFTYEKGVLENLRRKPVQIGETVRLSATADEGYTLKCGYNYPYLLVPLPSRLAEYRKLRKSVAEQLTYLQSHIRDQRYKAARATFAALRKLELTRHESEAAIHFAQTMGPEEQPVFVGSGGGYPDKIEEAYGVNVETLNVQEFIEFTREVLTNVRVNSARGDSRVDQTYLYRHFEDHPLLNDDLLVELIGEMIRARIPLLEQATEEMNSYWDHKYLIETSTGYLGRIGTPKSYETLANMISLSVDRKYYLYKRDDDTDIECPRRLDGLLNNACRAMFELFHENHEIGFAAQAAVKQWIDKLDQDNLAEDYVYSELRKLVPWSRY